MGLVLEPSVAGISVAGEAGLEETTMPGVVNDGLAISLIGDGRGDAAARSGARVEVGSAGGVSSLETEAWPLSVTAEWRERERKREVAEAARFCVRLRLGSVGSLVSVVLSMVGWSGC